MSTDTAMQHTRETIQIDRVEIPTRMREIDPAKVAELRESIARQGLMQPIGVTRRQSGYVLIWGLHRLQACEDHGMERIEAVVYPADLSDNWRLVLELEENLRRVELTPDQKTEHTLRLAAALKDLETLSRTENADTAIAASEAPTPATLPAALSPSRIEAAKQRGKGGRGHKGLIQKVAERTGVDQSGIRKRVARASEAIGEPIDLNQDSAEDLNRKADQFKAAPKARGPSRAILDPARWDARFREAVKTLAKLSRTQDRDEHDLAREAVARDPALANLVRHAGILLHHALGEKPPSRFQPVEPVAPEPVQEAPETPVEATETPVKADTDADAIRARLKASGLTGTRIAKLAGISQPAASRFLAGKTTPAPEKLVKLAALDI